MITTEELESNNKVYSRDYIRCDTCKLEIEVGSPTVFVNVTCGTTYGSRQYHRSCTPKGIERILQDG